jgi:hypothetical protein
MVKWRYSSTNLNLGSSWRWAEKGVDASRFQVQYDWNVKHRLPFLTAPFTVVVQSERHIFSLSSENPQMLNSWKYGKFAGQTFYKCCSYSDPDTVSANLPLLPSPYPPRQGCSSGAHRADSVPPPPSVRVVVTMKASRGNLQLKSDFKSISTWCIWREATVTKGC